MTYNLVGSTKLSTGDLGQGIAAVIIFLILLWLLTKYAWRPIIAQLNQREADIDKKITDADDRKNEADEIINEYEKKLSEIDKQASDIFANTKAEAAIESQKIIKQAHEEIREMRENAEADILSAKNAAKNQLTVQTAELATDIAKQLIASKLTQQDHDKMFKQASEKIAQLAKETNS